MQKDDNILELLGERTAQTARENHRAVILQPGAIGDCILTLPLAEFMKESLGLGGIDIVGHSEYIGFFPGRTCVDRIVSIDSMDLHHLFTETKTFDLPAGDSLINAFTDYTWIVTFLGEPNSDFEQNLIFTANCSHSAEVITLSMKPDTKFSSHLTQLYIKQFIEQSGMRLRSRRTQTGNRLIQANKTDIDRGRELLNEVGVDSHKKLVVIQPGSGGNHKCWHIDNFLAVAGQLVSAGAEVIFLLGPAEMDRFNDNTVKKISSVAKHLSGLPLSDVLGILSCSDGFIGNDSGITHIAAGLGIRTIAVFGPTNPVVYKPIGPAVKVFSGGGDTFTKSTSPALQQKVLDALTA